MIRTLELWEWRVSSPDSTTPVIRCLIRNERTSSTVFFLLFFSSTGPHPAWSNAQWAENSGCELCNNSSSLPGWVTKTIALLAVHAGPSSPRQSGHTELWATSGAKADPSNQLVLRLLSNGYTQAAGRFYPQCTTDGLKCSCFPCCRWQLNRKPFVFLYLVLLLLSCATAARLIAPQGQ